MTIKIQDSVYSKQHRKLSIIIRVTCFSNTTCKPFIIHQ
uniref:Uncharacterized protein n=1 Tax=Rhizophora mucronata TaxID=61149 RepID=A0A2P2PZD9_RHIMU